MLIGVAKVLEYLHRSGIVIYIQYISAVFSASFKSCIMENFPYKL